MNPFFVYALLRKEQLVDHVVSPNLFTPSLDHLPEFVSCTPNFIACFIPRFVAYIPDPMIRESMPSLLAQR